MVKPRSTKHASDVRSVPRPPEFFARYKTTAARDILDADMARRKYTKYPVDGDSRVYGGLLNPTVQSTFKLSDGTSILTVGSCFARNIERSLRERDFVLPTDALELPKNEVAGRAANILNQYNAGTMFQSLTNPDLFLTDAGLVDRREGGDEVIDLLLHTSQPVSRKRAIERRKEIAKIYREGLANSRVVILTLGLIEVWMDVKDGIFLNGIPGPRVMKADPGRYVYYKLTVADCEDLLRKTVKALCADESRQVLITVSPVPLGRTFTGQDAVSANCVSKSTLRVAANTIMDEFDRVDYFPSYEIVTSGGLSSFIADHIHVRQTVVDQAVDLMMESYMN